MFIKKIVFNIGIILCIHFRFIGVATLIPHIVVINVSGFLQLPHMPT